MAVEEIIQILKDRDQTVSTAESCTAGLISATIASISGASSVLAGGIVCYTNMVKKRIVGVKRTTLQKHKAVSEETAIEMAKGVRKKLRTDWSIAITGLVGPNGDGSEIPVGTIWIAIANSKKTWIFYLRLEGDRIEVQQTAAATALLHFEGILKQQ